MNPRCAGLLREALDLPRAQRLAFLQRASAGDADLLASLVRLMELDADADPFFDAPLDAAVVGLLSDPDNVDAELDDIAPGDRIGPWRVERKLGSGGMGSVWLAERADGEYEQQVALKTIKLGMDSAHVLAQFRRERNALARLQHANIASLVDGGVDDRGRPWFAMDYVRGVSLREWLATRPSLTRRLRLFEKLCRAVAYAHQRLVVHRDIKPGNVMVQADGEPRLLDFGIAKLMADDEDEQTMTLHRFASRSYAAPEQLRGEPVTTATDVYALGALLFELLTGTRYASVRAIDTVPQRPSQTRPAAGNRDALPAPSLRGDLDAIVVRAVAEEPARRYVSVQALADDIDNHLCERPVNARPDSGWYRLRRLVQRNRVASAALMVAFLALAVGLAVSLRQTMRADHQARRAEAVTLYLTGLFDAGRSNSAGTAVRERSVGDLLEDSASHLRGKLAKQPDVRDELYRILIEIFDSNDRPERSLALAHERVESAQLAWGAHDVRVAPALTMLAGVLINHGQLGPVPDLLDRAERLLDAVHDHDSMTRAHLWQWQGFYRFAAQDHPTYAGNPLLKAVALLRRTHPDSDDLLVALMQESMLALADGKAASAQAAITEMRERARTRYGEHSMYATQADFGEARLLLSTGNADKAYAVATSGVDAMRHFEGEHHHDVMMFEYVRILALLKLQRMDAARALWTKADTQRQRDWPQDANLHSLYADLATRLTGNVTDAQDERR